MVSVKKTKGFQYDPASCTNCLSCQLICSFSNTGRFNPIKAFVTVDFAGNDISFADDCLECGLCADYCPFGALVKAGEVFA